MFDALAPPLAEQVVVGAEAHSIGIGVYNDTDRSLYCLDGHCPQGQCVRMMHERQSERRRI